MLVEELDKVIPAALTVLAAAATSDNAPLPAVTAAKPLFASSCTLVDAVTDTAPAADTTEAVPPVADKTAPAAAVSTPSCCAERTTRPPPVPAVLSVMSELEERAT